MKITNYKKRIEDTLPTTKADCRSWLVDKVGCIFLNRDNEEEVCILTRVSSLYFDLIGLPDGNRYYECQNDVKLVESIFEEWIKLPKIKSITLDYGNKEQ